MSFGWCPLVLFDARHNQPTNQPTKQTNQTNKPNQIKPNQTKPAKKTEKTLFFHDSYQFRLEKVGKPNKNRSIPPKKVHLSWHYNSMPHWQMFHGIHRRMGGTSRKPKIRRRVLNSLNWQQCKLYTNSNTPNLREHMVREGEKMWVGSIYLIVQTPSANCPKSLFSLISSSIFPICCLRLGLPTWILRADLLSLCCLRQLPTNS